MVREGPPDVRPHGELLTAKRHFVIFNPASGRGRGAARIPVYRELLSESLDDVTFEETSRPGEERELAEHALERGFDVVIAVGGDGTWSNVADRLLSSGRDDVVLGWIPPPTGTCGDLGGKP